MSGYRAKVKARARAIKRWIKGYPRDVDGSLVNVFKTGFNMGWRANNPHSNESPSQPEKSEGYDRFSRAIREMEAEAPKVGKPLDTGLIMTEKDKSGGS